MIKTHNYILPLVEKCKTMIELKQLHGLMITTSLTKSIIPLSKLVDFCSNTQNLNYAETIFNQIDNPSVYIYNSMIKGFSFSQNPEKGLVMYKNMLQRNYFPDNFTFPFVFKVCGIINYCNSGKCVHNCVIKSGYEVEVYGLASLLNMYVSCGDMEAGLRVFDGMPKWNVVGWSSLIAGFVNNGMASEAIRVFEEMGYYDVEPNEITMVNVLVACGRNRDVETGRSVHDCIRQSGFYPFGLKGNFNMILATAIVDMYAKCGTLRIAMSLFNAMPCRNLVAWNAMISAFNQYGCVNEVFGLFSDMRHSGFDPDKVTFLSVISSCARLGNLSFGQGLHAYVWKTGFDTDTAIGTTLVDMYAKIGDACSAWRIFSDLQKKDALAWTSMIIGFAIHGQGKEALAIFETMQENTTVMPDQVTYIGVLSACTHIGLVEEGQRHFSSMKDVYDIVPVIEHYGCMVDLLSRAGHLGEAEQMMEQMPMQPNTAIWSSLLNGCQIYENVDLAEKVRSQIIELEPLAHASGVYTLLANVYTRAYRWQQAKRTRELWKVYRIPKTLGHSSVLTNMLSS